MGARVISFLLVPVLLSATVGYEVILEIGEKNTSSPFCVHDTMHGGGVKMVESLIVENVGNFGGVQGGMKLQFRWQTDKDPLYEHEWSPGQRDFRLIPEELFLETMYDFQYYFTVGKKKWDMSEGFYFKPMLLWSDYEGYTRYGEGFFLVKGEMRWGNVKFSLYGIPPRWEESATNRWYDCFQNGVSNWLTGGSFSVLVGGFSFKALTLWELPKEREKVISKYAFSTTWSSGRWTLYGEGSYKNGLTRVVPRFDGKETTNVYGIFGEYTNIVPAKYEFVEEEGSHLRMFLEGLIGVRLELPWDVTLRGEMSYRERGWKEDERRFYWDGVRYALDRYGNSLYQVGGDIPHMYLLQAASHLSLEGYSRWFTSLGIMKMFGDHWEVDQGVMMEMADFSWQWSGSVVWKSLQMWKVKMEWRVYFGKEESLFGALPEKGRLFFELEAIL